MLAFVFSPELCSRPELHGVSIGVVEIFSFPGLALKLLNTLNISALMRVSGIQMLTVRQLHRGI